ncbi:5-(carboxyamino)imidazole ribonucleotide synthase [Kribbella orskensis]|uniref:N5-carboxyaminoimidazole ribonucleotide synthase n=1 Tax=Kribbella orskensis TaxID=2512216 RepID=A0ABY2BXA5_9ACTN|nr:MULTISPECIES: 5-(carboxyamino)imidazole ribonucleotide synthase [Kribbella]TCN44158.1 5-(carboxyamino)imidazole ribonucleotide synthase [Kribbella sp. VKM Ac-2500]TCO32064.1 5-(carboxyamino)imidazole ribonucleotide synthase [Kribbella orskensis]
MKFERKDLPVGTPVVAMVGGGQLARMTQEAAVALGIQLRVLAEGPAVSAAQAVADAPVGDYRDPETVRRFAAEADVVTFDHEHVPTDLLRQLEADGVKVRPGPDALVHAQDKAVMRQRLDVFDAPAPAHQVVASKADVEDFAKRIGGFPIILKTTRGGYDGKGVWVAESADDPTAEEAFRATVPILAEEKVDFVRELSAVVARSPHGQAVAYPVVESVQKDGICVEVTAPAPGLAPDRAAQAQQTALRIAKELGVVGILAVEMFEARDGRLLVNELAMRPHNTGHWSIEGAVTSQFENHLRAVLDLPLGSPAARAPYTVMVNVLGGDVEDMHLGLLHCMARDPGLKVHFYGKSVKPGRKIGHVTAYGDDLEETRERARHAAAYLTGTIDE